MGCVWPAAAAAAGSDDDDDDDDGGGSRARWCYHQIPLDSFRH